MAFPLIMLSIIPFVSVLDTIIPMYLMPLFSLLSRVCKTRNQMKCHSRHTLHSSCVDASPVRMIGDISDRIESTRTL